MHKPNNKFTLVVAVLTGLCFSLTLPNLLVHAKSDSEVTGNEKISSKDKAVQEGILAPSAAAKRGQNLFEKAGCSECHSIENKGGCLAPPLDGVGTRRSERYMQLRLGKGDEVQFAHLIGHPEMMPHPRFNDDTVTDIIAYLKTIPSPKEFVVPKHSAGELANEPVQHIEWRPATPNAGTANGRRLFYDSGCMQCHSIGSVGGFLGPKLDGIGSRHTEAYIKAHVSNPQNHERSVTHGQHGSRMPQFDFSAEDVQQIADFLETLPNN